jgi:predicted nuclease of predicted toxin-antitoxin system
MRILVDENVPRMTVERLRELGHDVRDIRGTTDQGLEDPDLWTTAQTDGRVLITTDRGFTEFRAVSHCGILIVRLRQPNRRKIDQAVMRGLERVQEEEWSDLLVVVRDTTISMSRSGGAVERS